MLAAASSSSTWLRARRSRYLFLLLCSPIIIPLLCVSLPLLCAAELFLSLFRRRSSAKLGQDAAEDERIRRCEEGRTCAVVEEEEEEEEEEKREEMGLLQRYLEDQLLLVRSVIYDCGDEGDEDLYQEIHDFHHDSNTPLLA